MKGKKFGTWLVAAVAVLCGCDDNTGSMGMEMLPDTDGMSAHTVSFDVTTESVPAESVFAKTSTGYVGRYSDPDFGYFESGFMTALTCTENFTLPEVYKETEWDAEGNPTKATGIMTGDSVSALQLVVFYDEWFGDSLNACRMSAYELNRALDYDNRYTDIDPNDYFDPSTGLLGRKAYSAYDTTVPDSVRNETDSNGNPTYTPSIVFNLPAKEFGEDRILKPYRDPATHHYFDNPESFIDNVFKGLYLTTDQGDGTVLYVSRVDLRMRLHFFHVNDTTGLKLKKKDGTDSTYYSINPIFSSTKEVTQVNRFYNSDLVAEKASEKGWTYLKSPAGIFTQATLPYDEIYTQLANDTLNGARLTFTSYRQDNSHAFSMEAPTRVLLVRKQEYKKFFEDNELTDDITSYLATHNSSGTNQYVFSNIARLVTTCINEKQQAREAAGNSWDEEQWMRDNPDWNKVLLIPVSITVDPNNSERITGIQHDLQPGYAKLKGGPEGETLKLEVTYTRFHGENED